MKFYSHVIDTTYLITEYFHRTFHKYENNSLHCNGCTYNYSFPYTCQNILCHLYNTFQKKWDGIYDLHIQTHILPNGIIHRYSCTGMLYKKNYKKILENYKKILNKYFCKDIYEIILQYIGQELGQEPQHEIPHTYYNPDYR